MKSCQAAYSMLRKLRAFVVFFFSFLYFLVSPLFILCRLLRCLPNAGSYLDELDLDLRPMSLVDMQ